jgi:hypothetical protein
MILIEHYSNKILLMIDHQLKIQKTNLFALISLSFAKQILRTVQQPHEKMIVQFQT